jgi:hypothetical protein
MNKRIIIRWLMGPSLPHLIVLGLAVWGCWGAWHHFIVAADEITSVLAKVSGKNGTIAMADEDIGAMKSLIVHADLVARHEQQQLSTYDAYGAQLFADLHSTARKLSGTADSLSGTAQALTGTANAATATLQTTGTTIAAFQPILSHTDSAVAGLNARINDPHVTSLITHLEGMSTSGDKMLVDAQWKTHQLLHPDKVKLGFWGTTWAWIQAIHKLEPPIF